MEQQLVSMATFSVTELDFSSVVGLDTCCKDDLVTTAKHLDISVL